MDRFVERVTRQLEQVRDLFGLPDQVITAATPSSAGTGLLANWSGASSQGHDEAAGGVGAQHGALGDADAALDAFTRELGQETAARRARAEDLIRSARGTAESLGPQTDSVDGRRALASALTDHLSAASQLVIEHAESLPARQQQLAALTARFATMSGEPGPGSV
ncbi:hypothetical protein [Mycolicibacterium llatzerense]|uniref:hypothetical protein n=1 Tax=Mycolicibacterium llatzerense TaxID=280871 RepID=UPI0008DD8DC5|nr:hypothetical protein [Mycolicibacterium llatzerense]